MRAVQNNFDKRANPCYRRVEGRRGRSKGEKRREGKDGRGRRRKEEVPRYEVS
jgi:hypothetical protein